MKVDKLMNNNQPTDSFTRITEECRKKYPMHLVDIHPQEWVIDCGCNVGEFPAAFGDKFHAIMGIDASSYNINQFQKHHHHPTMHKGLWKTDGEILKLKKYMGNVDDEYEEVETMSLETLISKVGDIGLLKVDIEGAEFEFLLDKDLSRIKWITGEFHNWLFQTASYGIDLLEYIGETHEEVYSHGDGHTSHYIKLWKRRF